MSTWRIVYFGTPEYAVPALRALHADSRFEVVLVVTQPDRPAGRGHKLVAPPVKTAALSLGLSIYQPQSLRTPASRQPLIDANADLFIVAAFGLIFGEKTLAIPRYGAINLHASILPAYRGANPIAAAIASGESVTGVSLMQMERGLDSGPVIASRSIAIAPDDTTASLTAKLSQLGATLAIDAIPGFVLGATPAIPQPVTGVTLARPMRKSDGEVDWRSPAIQIDRHIRAMWPWPRAWSQLGDTAVQIHEAHVTDEHADLAPGEIHHDGRVLVGAGAGVIELDRVQFPGKSPVDAASAARGGLFGSHARFELPGADRDPLVRTLNDGDSTSV